MYCAQVANGRHCPKSDSAVPAQSTLILQDGNVLAFSLHFGDLALQNTMTWKV